MHGRAFLLPYIQPFCIRVITCKHKHFLLATKRLFAFFFALLDSIKEMFALIFYK
nr:MAG TPA: hypothetical protein [Caudoviricetes sp.]